MIAVTSLEQLDELTGAVAEAIAEQGIDPLREPDQVERIAGAVLATDPRVDRSDLPTVIDRVMPFGRLQRLFDDPLVEEVWFNRPDRVMVARAGLAAVSDVILTDDQVAVIVERMLRASGRRLDRSQPFVDATLPDGSRLHVAIPPITARHWAVNIRRYVRRPRHVLELVGDGVLTPGAGEYLATAMADRRSILIAGATQAGKTTMLNALLGSVGPEERIVSCEEVFEVRTDHLDWVALQTRHAGLEGAGEVSLGALVRESLRMRPTRLIVGEVRGAEALDLLIAANSGIATLSTVHANSAREAVLKLCTLPLLAGPNISASFVLPTVATSLDVVVHLQMLASGRREVTAILETTGSIRDGQVELQPVGSVT